MGTSPDNSGLRQSVQAYAQSLRATLAENIGIISNSTEYIPRSVYQRASLRESDNAEFFDWSDERKRIDPSRDRPSDDNSRGIGPPVAPPTPEDQVLTNWLAEGVTRSLLITAPVGAGKSCLLESFALQLADKLLDEKAGGPEGRSTRRIVPVVIPLAEVHRMPLEEYLLTLHSSQAQRIRPKPSLASEFILRLRDEGRLLLLLDGFDEVPASQQKLGREIVDLGIPFALTSRPGNDAERLLSREKWGHRTLQELRDGQVEEFVKSYFTAFPVPGALNKLAEAKTRPISRLLNRPLYLNAWCDWVRKRPRHRPPQSLCDLSRQLLRNHFERRIESTALRKAYPAGITDDALERFTLWFGRLGVYFANRGFCEQKLTDLDGQLILRDGQLGDGDLLQVADAIGLLKKIDDDFLLLKVPLVEYCIGWYLATDAATNADRPTVLIETFRRWIWRPNLHDILDYTFDALWYSNVNASGLRPWARCLLEWAVAVSRHDTMRNDGVAPHAHQDVLRPFALSALRWHAINTAADDDLRNEKTAAKRAAGELGPAISKAVSLLPRHNIDDILQAGPKIPIDLLREVIRSFAGQYTIASEEKKESWLFAIRAIISRRGSEYGARGLVKDFIAEHDAADFDSKKAWKHAAQSAATLMGERDAYGLLIELIQRYDGVDEGARTARRTFLASLGGAGTENEVSIDRNVVCHPTLTLVYVIPFVAMQLSENDAAQFLRNGVLRCIQAGFHETVAWEAAMRGAAGRLNRQVAAGFVRFLISSSGVPCAVESPLQQIIEHAAGRVSEEDAVGVTLHLVREFHEADETSLRHAITAAASQLNEDQAGPAISEWIANHNALGRQYSGWLYAIRGAACRISEREAPVLMNRLVRQSASAGDAGVYWWEAIREGCKRVGTREAATFVSSCMNQFKEASSDKKEALALAIAYGSRAIGEDSAPNMVLQFVDLQSTTADHIKKFLTLAIYHAASSVDEDQAPGLVTEWLRRYEIAQDTARWGWAVAVKAVAQRIPRNGARKLFGLTLGSGIMPTQVAALAAAAGGDIAIVSVAASHPVRYCPVLRQPAKVMLNDPDELVLDKEKMAVPDEFRDMLIVQASGTQPEDQTMAKPDSSELEPASLPMRSRREIGPKTDNESVKVTPRRLKVGELRDIQRKALAFCRRIDGFPGYKRLMEDAKCSFHAIRKAVEESSELKTYKDGKHSKSISAVTMSDVALESAAQKKASDSAKAAEDAEEASDEAVFSRVLESAKKTDADVLRKLPAEKQAELAAVVREIKAGKNPKEAAEVLTLTI
jgi:hypothetical protein